MIDRIAPVTKERAAETKKELLRWHSPAELRSVLAEISAPHGFFVAAQGAFQFWREAFCAREFAEHWHAERVRLCEPDPPDFELLREGSVTRWELVEVREPSEKPGAEFAEAARRHNEGLKQPVEPLDTDAHRRWLGPRLAEGVEKKAKKGYAKDIGLAIYIHAWIFDDQWLEVESMMGRSLAPFVNSFPTIMVLLSGRLFEFCADRDEPAQA